MVKEIIIEAIKSFFMAITTIGFFGLLLYKLWESIR
jgi:hypothetical protein